MVEQPTPQQYGTAVGDTLSTLPHVPHNRRLAIYGGFCSLAGPYGLEARTVCIEHRKHTAKHPITDEQAAREIDLELRDPTRCTVYGALKAVENLGGAVADEIRRVIASLEAETSTANYSKPTPGEVWSDAAEKALIVRDLDQMSGPGPSGLSHRDWLLHVNKESICGFSLVRDTNVTGRDIRHTLYTCRKELSPFDEAFAASPAFAHTSKIHIPFLHVSGLENRWTDHAGNPVEMSLRELSLRNCCNVQTISPDGTKLFLPGLKTKGLLHPIGDFEDATIVLLVEGWATGMTAYQATGLPVACVGGCSNFLYVAASMLEQDPFRRILMIGDSGTGDKLAKVYKAALAYYGSESSIAWAEVSGEDNYDLNDLYIDGLENGLANVREFINDCVDRFHQLNRPAAERSPFVMVQDMLSDQTRPEYLIDGVMPRAGIGALIGETGSFKSFTSLDMAASVATGTPFHGRKIRQANVLYIAGEGFSGYSSRVAAWQAVRGYCLENDQLHFTRGAVDILDTENLVETSSYCQTHDIGLVVFDTLHRCFSGDENSARDVGLALQNLGKHFTEHHIAVLLVHHTGHAASNRGRGSSSLRAAFDWELLAEKCKGGLTLTPTKLKDGELFPAETYQVVKQMTGRRCADGSVESSLVLRKSFEVRKALRLDRKQEPLLAALKSLGDSFDRQQAETATFTLIDSRKKSQCLSRFLDKLINGGWLVFAENRYRFAS